MSTATAIDRGFTIVRRLGAPREVVFQAWTDPEHLQWFANPGFAPGQPTTVDLRVGGMWRLHMVENEAKSYMTGGIYREIVPPEKLVFSWGAIDGLPTIDPARLDDVPLVTVTLNDVDGGTEMVVRVELADHLSDDEIREWLATGMAEGWENTLDRLGPQMSATSPSVEANLGA